MDLRMIGFRIQYARKYELNMTQEEFADLLEISKDTVSNIERGKVLPCTVTLVKISKLTDKSVDFFLSGELINHHGM